MWFLSVLYETKVPWKYFSNSRKNYVCGFPLVWIFNGTRVWTAFNTSGSYNSLSMQRSTD